MPQIDTNSEGFRIFAILFALFLVLGGWKFALESLID